MAKRLWRVYGQRGMDRYGPEVEVQADTAAQAIKLARPKLRPNADCYMAELICRDDGPARKENG